MEWIQSNTDFLIRWIHVVAGIVWIGHLYFFNFVNAHVAKTYDADSKKKVLPELMPRALYWFRWGAIYTWVTGFLLLAFVYYMPKQMVAENSSMSNVTASVITIGMIVVVFFIYDFIWKAIKNEKVGVVVSYMFIFSFLFFFFILFS